MRGLIQSVLVMGVLAFLLIHAGCRALRYDDQYANLQGHPPVENPLVAPLMDRQTLMEQISDEVDNYFRISREERIRVEGGILSEGWIETHPRIGSTLLEPWHEDSTSGFERIHATLQTVRRTAKVRIIPAENAFQIDLKVFKELEDLNQPAGAAIGGRPFRHDSALDIDRENQNFLNLNPGWIPMGRDFSLEQLMLRNIRQRLVKACESDDPIIFN
ncbi:MAG: hypothetical protein AAF623_03495 [Planctomycetota bacterium]